MGRMNIEIWALPLDAPAVPLPDLAGWEVSPSDVGDWGSVSLDYPIDGRNYQVLDELVEEGRDLEIEIAFTDDQGRQWLERGLLLDIDTDDVADTGTASVTGVLIDYLLGEVVVPYAPGADQGETAVAGTAGQIMRELLEAAQTRGCLDGVTWTFTDSNDSNGDPWERTASLRFSPGQHYAAVLGTLRGYQLSAWDLTYDRELVLVNPEGKGVDRTVAGGPVPVVTLERGRDLADAPRKFSLRDAVTAILSSGKDGLYSDSSDATAQAHRGRRIESYHSFGNASEQGTLDALTQARLGASTGGTTAVSHEVNLDGTGPLPLLDYTLSDWVLSATRRGVERRRVVQITVSGDGEQMTSAAVDLDAVFDDDVLRQSQRLDALEGGGVVVGTSTAPPDDVDDGSTPLAVDGLTVTSLWYATGEGVGLASVIAGWSPIPDERIDGYVVEWRYTAEAIPPASQTSIEKADAAAAIAARMASGDPIFEDWTWAGAPEVVGRWNDVLLDEFDASGSSDAEAWLDAYAPAESSSGWRRERLVAGTSTSWGSVTAGTAVRVRVAAQNQWGRLGPWSPVVEIVTEVDGVPPPVPSAPVVDNYLGILRIASDGLGSAGEAMPGDYERSEVLASQVDDFDLADDPLIVAEMVGESVTAWSPAGSLGGGDYGTTWFVKMRSRDRSGNWSELSEQAAAVPGEVQDGDVATLNVGKLTSGIMEAIVSIAGEFRTADPPDARVTINSSGVRKYDADNELRVEITDDTTRIDGEITVGDAGSASAITIGVGSSSARANVQAFDEVGGLTTVIGQVYSATTGLPIRNGVLVTRDDPLRNLLEAYGSGEFAGVRVRHSDNPTGNGTVALQVVDGESDVLRMIADNGTLVYIGPLGVNEGVLICDTDGATQRLHATRVLFNFQLGGSGGQPRIRVSPDYAHIGLFDGTDTWGFEMLDRARIKSNVRPDVTNADASSFADLELRSLYHNGSLIQTSSAAAKEDFRPMESALDVLRAAPAARWRRLGSDVDEVGPVAEDLPAWMRQTFDQPGDDPDGEPRAEGVNLNSEIGLLWEAVRELDTELDELRAEKGRPVPARRKVADLLGDLAAGRIQSATRRGRPNRTEQAPDVDPVAPPPPAEDPPIKVPPRRTSPRR